MAQINLKLSTYLGSWEESCASLMIGGKILSVRSLPPDRTRAAPTLFNRSARCCAANFLTTGLRWLSAEESNNFSKQKLLGWNYFSPCLQSNLIPPVSKAPMLRVGVQCCTMQSSAASTSCLMKVLLSPAFCSKALTVPSSSWSISLCRCVYRSPIVQTATLDTPERRFFTWLVGRQRDRKRDAESLSQQVYCICLYSLYICSLNYVVNNCSSETLNCLFWTSFFLPPTDGRKAAAKITKMIPLKSLIYLSSNSGWIRCCFSKSTNVQIMLGVF